MWNKIKRKGLDVDFNSNFFSVKEADILFKELESEITYFTGDLARVKVFGKWHDVPRQQVAYGDPGLVYKYSGLSVPAQEWTQTLIKIRNKINQELNKDYNFVLINRYRNGKDYMGFHKDDEKELDINAGIASLSLGQTRDFVFRYSDKNIKNIPPLKMILNNGSLLIMNHPTNEYWHHSLPKRLSSNGVRLNLTFRKIINK